MRGPTTKSTLPTYVEMAEIPPPVTAESPSFGATARVDDVAAYLAEVFSLQPDVPDEVAGVGADIDAKAEADRKHREAVCALARAQDAEVEATPGFPRGSGNKPRKGATDELSFQPKTDACR